MTEKEEQIFRIISEFIKNNNTMPTRRYIQKKLNYKSINSITQYYQSLEKKGYLKRNNYNKVIANSAIYDNNFKRVKIVNTKNKEIKLHLNKKKNYLGYKLNNNYFKKDNLLKKDILIIEKKKKLNIGDIGLFIVDNKYRVMKYDYKDGFYLLSDHETIYLNHITVIGKVIQVIRKI